MRGRPPHSDRQQVFASFGDSIMVTYKVEHDLREDPGVLGADVPFRASRSDERKRLMTIEARRNR